MVSGLSRSHWVLNGLGLSLLCDIELVWKFLECFLLSIDSFLSNPLTEETKHTQGEMVMYGSKAPQNGNENHAPATVWCNS